MSGAEKIKIATFYEFKQIPARSLPELRSRLKTRMRELEIKGTVILAEEGFNSTLCGGEKALDSFLIEFGELLKTRLDAKVSFHSKPPFRRIEVKIKKEIVTLKQDVDISLGKGTHVSPEKWNEIISDEQTIVLDTRNDYEFETGTFVRAINPKTKRFSDLPAFVNESLDPTKHKNVAMFCTGGIRCEKFAPYMKQLGFENVYQLEGGILKYLERVNTEASLWQGECFVFDDRVSVDSDLKKGSAVDHSQDRST
jgi:UPF0176 protein